MKNHENDLTADERSALDALPREMQPGDLLEERVVRALRNQGHFGGRTEVRGRPWSVALRIAAAIALFAGGVATGRAIAAPGARPAQAAARSEPLPVRSPYGRAGQERRSVTDSASNETVIAVREIWL